MVINYSNDSTYSVTKDGGYIWRWNTQDGHGGMAREHRAEMAEIANQIAEQKIKVIVPQIVKEIYKESLADMLRGIKYDINTIVEFAFEDGEKIFTSSKSRKAVSEAIYNEILKGLKDIEIKVKL